jgi:hypothetical protein
MTLQLDPANIGHGGREPGDRTRVDYAYRFRSTHALLDGHQELENQEIYFASPSELNDPLEGFKDLFWQGDLIVWKNFVRHYLLCLMLSVLSACKHPGQRGPESDVLPVFTTDGELPGQERELFRAICTNVFDADEVGDLPKFLASRVSPIHRNELLSILWAAHPHLLRVVCKTISPDTPLNPIDEYVRVRPPNPLRFRESIAAQNDLDAKNANHQEITENFMDHSIKAIAQAILIREYNGISRAGGPLWEKIFSTFPERYVNSLERLLYYDWFAACFVVDPNDAAMWGNYGDGHKGVCLKFRTTSNSAGKPSLLLRTKVGERSSGSGPVEIYEFSPLQLEDVQYCEEYPRMDFFKSLGRLVPSQLAFWFTDGPGHVSATGTEILQGSDQWRKQYWETFDRVVTSKLRDWQHEREQRITLHSMLFDISDRSMRKLQYRFDDLEGIIFGIKTPMEEKIAIMRIIEAKCRKNRRKGFEFRQTFYSSLSKRIESTPLGLLKFG